MANKIREDEIALIDSPQFTANNGFPTTPTPSEDSRNSEIANTFWVKRYTQSVLNLPPFDLSQILYVSNIGNNSLTGGGQRGNINRPYTSIADAHSKAASGDIIFVFPGVYATDFALTTVGVRLILSDGTKITAATPIFGGFDGYTPYDFEVYGGEFTRNVLACRQNNGFSRVTFTGTRFTGLGGVQYIANASTNSFIRDEIVLRNCLVLSDRPTPANMTVNSARGPVRLNGRTEFGSVNIILDSTLVVSTNTSCITISSSLGYIVTLMGTTELRPGVGQVDIETIDNGQGIGPLPIESALFDYRILEIITENQYGNHPAFRSQARLNEYLLRNKGTGTPTPIETLEILDVQGSDDIVITNVTGE